MQKFKESVSDARLSEFVFFTREDRGFYTKICPFFRGDGIFVFGSNLKGIHGKGAAKTANQLYGASYGVGHGMTGRAYALPTKLEPYTVLGLSDIEVYVDLFCTFTKRAVRENPKTFFYVTAVGTGESRYGDAQMAPLFEEATNCLFPNQWRKYL